MKRLLILATACAASAATLLVGAGAALADAGPHHASAGIVTDTCAGCHRLHTAPAPHLLKQSQESLCYSCHGSGGPGSLLDVVNGVSVGGGGALRGGGFEYALLDTDNPSGSGSGGSIPTLGAGEASTSTHSVNGSAQTAWGWSKTGETPQFGLSLELRCGNCHNPHGEGTYRILRETPRGIYSHGEAHPEVEIPDPASKIYTTTNYWYADDPESQFDNEGKTESNFALNIAKWCTICHTRYLADHEGHTDSGDPVYAYRHTSDDDRAGAGRRNCVQCHVAHGSNAHMGENSEAVPFPDGSHVAGDSRLLRIDSRGVCKMCHGSY